MHLIFQADGDENKNKLSMLFGVTLPCVLSIFSVILFLRLGLIVGQVCSILEMYCNIYCVPRYPKAIVQ